jgi:hypothetical protein
MSNSLFMKPLIRPNRYSGILDNDGMTDCALYVTIDGNLPPLLPVALRDVMSGWGQKL